MVLCLSLRKRIISQGVRTIDFREMSLSSPFNSLSVRKLYSKPMQNCMTKIFHKTSQHPNCTLHIIMNGGADMYNKLHKFSIKLKYSSNVIFIYRTAIGTLKMQHLSYFICTKVHKTLHFSKARINYYFICKFLESVNTLYSS